MAASSSKHVDSDRVNARRLSTTRNLVAGSIGGMFAWMAGQPLDIVKVRMQVQPGKKPLYTSALDCLAKTIKAEGIRGLYRGMLAPVLVAAPVTAVSFYSLSLGKSLQLDNPNKEPTTLQYFNAGLFCGVCVAFFYAPAERLKSGANIPRNNPLTPSAFTIFVKQLIGPVKGGDCPGLTLTMTCRRTLTMSSGWPTKQPNMPPTAPDMTLRDGDRRRALAVLSASADLKSFPTARVICVRKRSVGNWYFIFVFSAVFMYQLKLQKCCQN